jgi:hypothetical protein
MSVLARDLDAYRRALAIYQRKVASHNSEVTKFNSSMVKDANGNDLIQDANGGLHAVDGATGNLIAPNLPQGFDAAKYGSTALPDNPSYSALRQNPVGQHTEKVSGAYKVTDENGVESYYTPTADSFDTMSGRSPVKGSGWQVAQEHPGQQSADGPGPSTYDLTRQAGDYLTRPADFTAQFNQQAPSYTQAAAAAAARPSYAQQEAGLIGEVLKGRGVRY